MQHIFLWWTCRSYKGTKYILDFLSPLRKENRNEKLSFSCSFNPCQLQKCLLIQKFLMNRVANEREALYGTKCRRETFCPASCASLLWWSAGRNQWFQKVSEEKQQYLILIFLYPASQVTPGILILKIHILRKWRRRSPVPAAFLSNDRLFTDALAKKEISQTRIWQFPSALK